MEKSAPIEVDGEWFGYDEPDNVLDFSQADPSNFPDAACVILRSGSNFRGWTVIAPSFNPLVAEVDPVVVLDASEVEIRDVVAKGSGHAQIYVLRSSLVEVVHCTVDGPSGTVRYGYGVQVIDSANVIVKASHGLVDRHAFTVGGAAEESVGVHFVGCVGLSRTHSAGDAHPGTRDCRFALCSLQGLSLGGKSHIVSDCVIHPGARDEGIFLNRLENLDHEIVDCRIEATGGTVGVIGWDRAGDDAPDSGGTLRFLRCEVVASSGRPVFLRNRWPVDPSVMFKDCVLSGGDSCFLRSLDVPSRWVLADLRGSDGTWNTGAHVTTVITGP